MKHLEDFLRPTQKELFKRLCKMYPSAVVNEGEYILVPGEAPVLLVAHLDTVHTERVRQICKTANGNVLMSPPRASAATTVAACMLWRPSGRRP